MICATGNPTLDHAVSHTPFRSFPLLPLLRQPNAPARAGRPGHHVWFRAGAVFLPWRMLAFLKSMIFAVADLAAKAFRTGTFKKRSQLLPRPSRLRSVAGVSTPPSDEHLHHSNPSP